MNINDLFLSGEINSFHVWLRGNVTYSRQRTVWLRLEEIRGVDVVIKYVRSLIDNINFQELANSNIRVYITKGPGFTKDLMIAIYNENNAHRREDSAGFCELGYPKRMFYRCKTKKEAFKRFDGVLKEYEGYKQGVRYW